MYDIVIIGAGPAGATLARILDKKYKVLIVDRRNLDQYYEFKKIKCCGGLLAPSAQRALSTQGLGLPHDIITGPQTFSVKSVDFDNDLVRYYQRHYINIDREKFDRWLVSLIPESVSKCFSCIYKNYTKQNDYYSVTLDCNGEPREVKTKLIIGADGALSRVREQAFKGRKMPEKYVSIQDHYETAGDLPYYVSIFDKSVTDFYSWIIQKDRKLLVGTAVPEKYDSIGRYEILIEKLKSRGFITGSAVERTGTLIMRTRRLNQLCYYTENIALIGEAAGFISPSSAEGISYALLSGEGLAESINKNINDYGRLYSRKVLLLKANLAFKGLKVKLMYNKTIRKLIMKSKIFSMEIKTEK